MCNYIKVIKTFNIHYCTPALKSSVPSQNHIDQRDSICPSKSTYAEINRNSREGRDCLFPPLTAFKISSCTAFAGWPYCTRHQGCPHEEEPLVLLSECGKLAKDTHAWVNDKGLSQFTDTEKRTISYCREEFTTQNPAAQQLLPHARN